VVASGGYPGEYKTGFAISGLEAATNPSILLFHYATRKEGDAIVTDGGRILGVSAIGKDSTEARERAYAAVEKIQFEGMQYRKDIGII